MKIVLRNIAAVLVALVLGSGVNMLIITLGSILIPAPAGVDVNDIESIAAAMPLYEVKHFVAPFLAHALGTLVAGCLVFVLAGSYQQVLTWLIGGLFLLGGITASVMLPAPIWFIVVDLTMAYLPMAWLAILLGQRLGRNVDAGVA